MMNAQNPVPVFLICSERSGSNLISQIMGAHSGVHSPPPFHFGRIVLLNMHETLQDGTGSKAWELISKRVVNRVRKLQSDADAERVKSWLKSQKTVDPQTLARYLYQDMTPDADGKVVFVKENNLHHLLFFILHCFPGARFVFQVRDPRDYLASAKALRAGETANKFGSNRNAIKVWHDDQQGGLHALGLLGKDRVFLHRYEDLVSNSEDVLQRLCTFLGLTFEPGMLDFYKTDEAVRLAASAGPRKNISKPLMSSNFAKYRTSLSGDEIRMVERRLGSLMDLFGYPREHEPSRRFYSFAGLKTRPMGAKERPPLLPPLSYDTKG